MMRKITLLFVLCFTILTTQAQKTTLNCNDNLQQALTFLRGNDSIQKDSLKGVALLKPCLRARNANTQLVMGHLYLNASDNKSLRKGFQLIRKAAKQKHPVAMENLAVLYKYGRGCKLNYNRARKWFQKAAVLGNDKAAYSLGYMSFKGLGNTPQDYTEAVQWFQKSNYPMAKYWLGVCYLKGYGIAQNTTLANAYLNTHFESQTAAESTNAIPQKTTVNSAQIEEQTTETALSEADLENELYGSWSGQLLQLDWSGQLVENSLPLQLTIAYDANNENSKYTWKINNRETTGDALYVDEALYFDELNTTLPHTAYYKEAPTTLTHQILSSDLTLKRFAGTPYLIGELESYLPKRNEPSAPMRFVLTKEIVTSENGVEIAAEIIAALATQKNNFIKLYPNPFVSDLIVAYQLEAPSHIQIQITNITDPTETYTIETGQQQATGAHRYHFDGSRLKKGLYAVQVFVNGAKKTKLIVKK